MMLQAWLVIFLPVVTPLIGSSVAAMIAQDGWPAGINDGIAWFILLVCAALNIWASNVLMSGLSFAGILAAIIGVVTMLISGGLAALDPYLAYLGWIQSNVFDLVPILKGTKKS